jgi:hypothetical protein
MLQTFEFAVAEGVIRLERNLAEVNAGGPVADEAWRFTDGSGHEHAYVGKPREPIDHYPTLAYAPGPSYYCGECGDEHEDYAVSHYECRICGEVIEPGSREPRDPEAMYLTHQALYLNGEPITRERAEALVGYAMTAQKNDGNQYEVNLPH